MSVSNNQSFISDENDICHKLFQAAIDAQSNLIVLMYDHAPILFNKAFQEFTGMPNVKMFLREFGSLPNRFVPHDAYFHAGKASDLDQWTSSLMELPESERIVSMINYRAEPFAFSVTAETPAEGYSIVSFVDISQDLIKRIMIENDVSIDKESGAFNKDYFVHTAKSFQNAALFNEKAIGITMIQPTNVDNNASLHDFVSTIKNHIRQSDMLVRWEKNIFLLAYLVDSSENAMKCSQKLCSVATNVRIGTAVQLEHESMSTIIQRAHDSLSAPL
ncbi:MAG: hypothetical protein CJD30_07300 [Sulfuricurvum sp. PD_MW2]|jgi:hypothetical protein|uniref:hypothetical protein n=1 Tax=Sulfuricurvum sp. PD_MW2 TaxID=2027917 RepID=UPI000C0649A4|nr:hypothetical protein [Sulfuricurvum sp. PD_MW2]PHM17304.1 MAG: hypothetical protein CJD30_07300 [Sulfuricurvum sp. PD_MW2]